MSNIIILLAKLNRKISSLFSADNPFKSSFQSTSTKIIDNQKTMSTNLDVRYNNTMSPSSEIVDANQSSSSNESRNEAFTQISTHSYVGLFSSLVSSLRWSPTSEEELEVCEARLLSVLKRPFKTYFVDIGPAWDLDKIQIRTIEMLQEDQNRESKKQPLVLVHGFGIGIGGWILNLDELSTTVKRKIFAFDIIGFGRSSRPSFDLENEVEEQFVDAIEKWRIAQGIDKFIILGHSFGGYLSAGYALRHPERVSKLILADPWGVQDRQLATSKTVYRFPIWVRGVNKIFQYFAPLAVIRATGPCGPHLVRKFRADLKEKFRPKLNEECECFLDYIYHCNAKKASGELAFKALALPFGWPKFPLLTRLMDLKETVKMTFIYGSRSWIATEPGEVLRERLGPERVSVHVIQGSGHHVYADKSVEFNALVTEACSNVHD